MGQRMGLLGSGPSFEEIAALAVLAEDLGFDAFFLPEHHQEPFWPSAPLITLAGVAARTQRIRLGTAVTVMGLHNPVRLAEETATLDRSSGGRAPPPPSSSRGGRSPSEAARPPPAPPPPPPPPLWLAAWSRDGVRRAAS